MTRMLYMGLIPRHASQKDVCMYHKHFLKEIDADVTGLMILHGTQQQQTTSNKQHDMLTLLCVCFVFSFVLLMPAHRGLLP